SRLRGELAEKGQALIKEINEDIASNDAAVNEVLQRADPARTHAGIETESPLIRLHDERLGVTAHLREHLCRISPENRSFLVYRQGPDKGEKGLMNVDLASLAESELIEIALRPESRLPFCEEDRAAMEGIRLFRQRDDQS